jgi:hypothetical protein
MKITKRQLKRMIQEIAMGHDMMAYESEERAQDDEFNRGYMAATEGLPSDVDTSEYPRHYMRGYDAGLEKSEWMGESTRSYTLRRIRRLVREAMDVVNVETGEVLSFGDGERDVAPDSAVPDLVKRLALSMGPSGELSNADWEKLELETLGKQADRQFAKSHAKIAADRERLNIDNLLQRLRDWAAGSGDEYMADNPEANFQDVAIDLAATAEYSFKKDEWEELLWHFDNDEYQLNLFTAENM